MLALERDKERFALDLTTMLALIMSVMLIISRVDMHSYVLASELKAQQSTESKSKRDTLEGSNRNRMNLDVAWKRLCGDSPQEKQDTLVKLRPRSAERFAGFVEGFTGAKLPRWWEEALFSARGHPRYGFGFIRPKSWPYEQHDEEKDRHRPEEEMILQRGVKYVKKGDWNVLQRKEAVIRIPKEVRDAFTGDHLSLTLQGNKYFIATHLDVSRKYRLFCVSRATSKILWKTYITPDNDEIRGFSGLWWHCIEIVPQEKAIVVFGAASDTLYVVGLDAENGNQLFRFSSYRSRR
jgi:hypothetical protein